MPKTKTDGLAHIVKLPSDSIGALAPVTRKEVRKSGFAASPGFVQVDIAHSRTGAQVVNHLVSTDTNDLTTRLGGTETAKETEAGDSEAVVRPHPPSGRPGPSSSLGRKHHDMQRQCDLDVKKSYNMFSCFLEHQESHQSLDRRKSMEVLPGQVLCVFVLHQQILLLRACRDVAAVLSSAQRDALGMAKGPVCVACGQRGGDGE